MEPFTSTTQFTILVLLTTVIADAIRRFTHNCVERKGYSLPPGPTRLPFLGSALSVNTNAPWLTYTEWQAKYGDIVYTRLLDSDVIVLNSCSVATELLEKRSNIYSDRPFIATVEPYGHDSTFVFSQYGEHWRLCRRIFHQTFRADAALAFRPKQLHRARELVANIIEDPDEYPFHYSTFSAGVAMSSVYDYPPSPQNDPIVSAIENFLQASAHALTPNKAALLKIFPSLLNIPDYLPGSSLKRGAREATKLKDIMNERISQYVQKRLQESRDEVNDAMVFDHIARMKSLDGSYRVVYERALIDASVTAFLGSAETTSSAFMVFTHAMVRNPHVWQRAQADIDHALGTDRLPDFGDRRSLPYIDAIVRETFRWTPVAPMGIPHATTESDVYKGFYIPKGATVVANVWAMCFDESRYPNPEAFIPERFLDAQGRLTDDDPADFTFGFGRRACPGRHAADASVWSVIVTMLATLDFNTAKDKDGKDVAFEPTYTNGLSYHLNKFPCRLIPRKHISKKVLERVLRT